MSAAFPGWLAIALWRRSPAALARREGELDDIIFQGRSL